MLFPRSNTPRTASYVPLFLVARDRRRCSRSPALYGAIKTDVAIAGGGYFGLWTLQNETLALSRAQWEVSNAKKRDTHICHKPNPPF